MAYVIRVEYEVGLTDRAAFEAAQAAQYAEIAKLPGFISSTLGNSAGYPMRYTRFSRWESRQAVLDCWANQALWAAMASIPTPASMSQAAPLRAYDELDFVFEGGDGTCAVLAEANIAAASAAAYEESRKQYLALARRECSGITATSLARLAGRGSQFYWAAAFRTDADLAAATTNPALAAFIAQSPIGNFGSLVGTQSYIDLVVTRAATVAA